MRADPAVLPGMAKRSIQLARMPSESPSYLQAWVLHEQLVAEFGIDHIGRKPRLGGDTL
jgi:hypothetical protein